MSELKVFISSTCYDLGILRESLRSFTEEIGYKPVMSEYGDILYDLREHTHTSCIDEVSNCDMLILIIGSRFGGKGSIESLNTIDFKKLENESSNIESLKEKSNLSITQLEVLKAIENKLPLYIFIEDNVWNDHHVYQKNKDKDIHYPSIEKQETAKYIFSFIDFVRLRYKGNSIYKFREASEICSNLKKQWAGYFQKLLHEQRTISLKEKSINEIKSTDIKSIKESVIDSFDITKSNESFDYNKMVQDIVNIYDVDQIYHLLDDADNAVYKLNDKLIKNNYITFLNYLIYSRENHVINALQRYFFDERYIIKRFIYSYLNNIVYINQLLTEITYVKKLFNRYREDFSWYNFKKDEIWIILKVVHTKGGISKQEYEVFYRSIINYNCSSLLWYDPPKEIQDIWYKTGFYDILLEKVNYITVSDWNDANLNENLLKFALKNGKINKKFYSDIEYLIRKRHAGTTMYDGIVEYLGTSEGKNKIVDYEKKSCRNDISKYFGW